MKKPSFIVWAPPYNEKIGGVVVLHQLAHELAILGYSSYIFTSKKNPKLQGIHINREYIKSIDKSSCIVIYPEVVRGNPLAATHVVRWILNTVGTVGGDGKYADTDMVFLYCSYFTLDRVDLIKGELNLFTLDLDTFKDLNLPRSGQCIAIRKGKTKPLIFHDKSATNIDGKSNIDIQRIFNEKEIFISYDHVTFLSVQAALSGCISIVIPDGVSDKETWVSNIPILKYGVAYGMEDIDWAKSTKHLVKPYLESLLNKNKDLILNFIKICTDRINFPTIK